MRQLQRRRDLVHFALALDRLEREDAAQARQLRVLARLPSNLGEPVFGAPAREVVSNQPKSEVVGDQVRSGNKEEHTRSDEEQPVDDDPFHVAVGLALELCARETRRRVRRHVVGVMQHQLALIAKPPQKALLGDLLGEPAHPAIFHALGPRPRPVVHARLAAEPSSSTRASVSLSCRTIFAKRPLGRHLSDRFGRGVTWSQ